MAATPSPIGRKSQAKAVVSGILADPAATDRLKLDLVKRLEPEARRLRALVQSRTPVSDGRKFGTTNPPPGTLRERVEARAFATKKGVGISVSADKATRKGTKGDPPRRYGRVPYGVFIDNETGFVTDTVTDEYGRMLDAINAAVLAHAAERNAERGDSPRER